MYCREYSIPVQVYPFPTPICVRFSAGTLGPAIFGLGLRDSCLVILFFNLLCSALPSYL